MRISTTIATAARMMPIAKYQTIGRTVPQNPSQV
jgi:hypothetical protein